MKLNSAPIPPSNTSRPIVGQTVTVHGKAARITRVHPFGTIDVVTAAGRAFRMTGLSFL